MDKELLLQIDVYLVITKYVIYQNAFKSNKLDAPSVVTTVRTKLDAPSVVAKLRK